MVSGFSQTCLDHYKFIVFNSGQSIQFKTEVVRLILEITS